MLALVAVFCAAEIGAQVSDNVFNDGMEDRLDLYQYSWISDQFVVAEAGTEREFEVEIRNSSGDLVPDGNVQWTSSSPTLVNIIPISPRRARAQILAPATGTVRLSARHPLAANESQAQVIFETLLPQSRFIPGNQLINSDDTSAVFATSLETSAITTGDIILVGDTNPLLVRILSIFDTGSTRIAQTEPAYLSDFFVNQAAPVAIEGDAAPMVIEVRDGIVTYRGNDRHLIDTHELAPDSIQCTVAGGNTTATLDPQKIVISGATPGDYANLRLRFDWRDTRFDVLGNWNAQVTLLPGAISLGTAASFSCVVNLPAVAVPGAGISIYVARIGLTVAPSLRIEGNLTSNSALIGSVGFQAKTNGSIGAGLDYSSSQGWTAVGTQSAQSTNEIRQADPNALSGETGIELRAFVRAEPEIGVARRGANFSARFAEIDLGGKLVLNVDDPTNQLLLGYAGPEGGLFGFARGSLKAPQSISRLVDEFRRTFPNIPGLPPSLQLALFDVETQPIPWNRGALAVTPSQVSQSCESPTLSVNLTGFRSTPGLSSGRYRLVFFREGQFGSPVWTSPEQQILAGSAAYALPINQITSSGVPVTGTLRTQVRVRYNLDPVTSVLPVTASSSQTVTINTGNTACGPAGISVGNAIGTPGAGTAPEWIPVTYVDDTQSPTSALQVRIRYDTEILDVISQNLPSGTCNVNDSLGEITVSGIAPTGSLPSIALCYLHAQISPNAPRPSTLPLVLDVVPGGGCFDEVGNQIPCRLTNGEISIR